MEAIVSYLFVLLKYINSKQNTQIKYYTLCLGNISKDFTINSIKKSGIKRKCKIIFYFNPIDSDYILDIHRSLMKGK